MGPQEVEGLLTSLDKFENSEDFKLQILKYFQSEKVTEISLLENALKGIDENLYINDYFKEFVKKYNEFSEAAIKNIDVLWDLANKEDVDNWQDDNIDVLKVKFIGYEETQTSVEDYLNLREIINNTSVELSPEDYKERLYKETQSLTSIVDDHHTNKNKLLTLGAWDEMQVAEDFMLGMVTWWKGFNVAAFYSLTPEDPAGFEAMLSFKYRPETDFQME